MLSFQDHLDHLTEDEDTPFEKRDICWYLSQPNERKLMRALVYMDHGATEKVHPTVQGHMKAILKWFETRGTDKVWLPKLMEMLKCPNRADWTMYKGGIIYRGIHRSWPELKKLKYTGKVSKDSHMTAFVADGVYTSRYSFQSWTSDWKIGVRFANNPNHPAAVNPALGRDIGIVCEAKVDPKDTLFNPEICRKLSDYGSEKEVIRTSNEPLPIKVYVNVSSFEKALGSIASREGRMLELAKLVGDANAKILAKTPLMKAILQH